MRIIIMMNTLIPPSINQNLGQLILGTYGYQILFSKSYAAWRYRKYGDTFQIFRHH